jgi:hypothetical protein
MAPRTGQWGLEYPHEGPSVDFEPSIEARDKASFRALYQGVDGSTSYFQENNDYTEMCGGSEAGSFLRPIDLCITQLWASE